jgi:hypothetical protein
MKIGTKGFLGIVVLVLSATLAAMVAGPGQLLAQDPVPLASGSHPAPVQPSRALECSAPAGPALAAASGSSASPFGSNALQTFGRVFRLNGVDTNGDSIWPRSDSDGYFLVADHELGSSSAPSLVELGPIGHVIHSYDLSIAPGWPRSVTMTGDGGYLIGTVLQASTALQGQPGEPGSGLAGSLAPTRQEAVSQRGQLLKLSPTLAVQWAKAFSTGEPSAAHVAGLAQTVDGGYVVAVRDDRRFGVVKLTAAGGLQWKKGILSAQMDGAVTVYSVVETTYLDAEAQRQCGGYVLYGGVQRTGTDWDLYLAALSCDGKSLLWQRIVSGPGWEASYNLGGYFFDYTTNLVIVEDRAGFHSQDASLLLAATSNSFDTGQGILLVPFRVTGDTTLSNPPEFGPFKILDGLDREEVIGPYGGPNLIRLSDGNLLLGGSIVSASSGEENALLVKMTPGLDIVWQLTYDGLEQMISMYELPDSLLASGGGPSGVVLRLQLDGSGEGPCLTPFGSNLTVSDVAPEVVVPAYPLDDGTLQITNTTVGKTEVPAELTCPRSLYLPVIGHIQR